MNDIAQTNLKEPAKVDWENYGKSKFQAPPPALDANFKPITYYGVATVKLDEPDTSFDSGPYLQYLLDPIKIVQSGTADGYEVRFTQISVRPYTIVNDKGERVPKKGNPNKLADFLRSTGATGTPQLNSEYAAAVKMVNGKPFPFTVDWVAKNKDTGEKVEGYLAFPENPEFPGTRKAILKKGDVYNVLDKKGNIISTKVVQSEILFANARLRWFGDPKKGK